MTAAYCQQNANYVTILAIYDEQEDVGERGSGAFRYGTSAAGGLLSPGVSTPNGASKTIALHTPPPSHFTANTFSTSSDGDIVEITSLTEPPVEGLRVLSGVCASSSSQQPSSSTSSPSSLSTCNRADGFCSLGSVSCSVPVVSPLRGEGLSSPECSSRYELGQQRLAVPGLRRPVAGVLKNPGEKSPKPKHKVTLSPEVERKLQKALEGGGEGGVGAAVPCGSSVVSICPTGEPTTADLLPPTRMARSSARKSRITDSFFDAKERLEDALVEQPNNVDSVEKPPATSSLSFDSARQIPPIPAANPTQTIIVLSEATVNRSMGIEISPVQDPTNTARLQSVEIRQIDDEGRVATDGRIRVGDYVVEINQRPVYQMSISRARAYLHELQSTRNPTLTIDRPVDTFLNSGSNRAQSSSASNVQKRPILSALQQANTTAIGVTSSVEVTKSAQGFGFTVTSRDTAKGERLFYIGTVKPNGAAMGVLKAGDRLLQINETETTGLKQSDVVDRLKQLKVGESIQLLISRLSSSGAAASGAALDEEDAPNASVGSATVSTTAVADAAARKSDAENEAPSGVRDGPACGTSSGMGERKGNEGEEIIELEIPLNDTGSAGLGVSLKARAVMKPDGTRHDCGIFIKKVLHGGAAFKDGRLRVNDQLIGIEDIDLRSLKKNSEASDAITRCLKAIGPSATVVRLLIARSAGSADKVASRESERLSDDSLLINRDAALAGNHVEIPRMRVDGYGDYSLLLKKSSSSSSSGGKRVNGGLHRSDTVDTPNASLYEDMDSLHCEQKYASDDESAHVSMDAFNRENPTRRSMSEKRHMGSSNDPSHTLVFQKIKHSRQASAPTLRETSVSGVDSLMQSSSFSVAPLATSSPVQPSRAPLSLQEKNRRRGSSRLRSSILSAAFPGCSAKVSGKDSSSASTSASEVTLRGQATTDRNGDVPVTLLKRTQSIDSLTSPRRRSLSLENMGARKAAASSRDGTVNEAPTGGSSSSSRKVLPSALKKMQRSKVTSESFRHATELFDSLGEKPTVPDYEEVDGCVAEPCASLPRGASPATRDKQRRKSVGSSLFSKISQKLGSSRSRDSSPEKPVASSYSAAEAKELERRRQEDERKRIQDQYDRLKQKQQQQRDTFTFSKSCVISPPATHHAHPHTSRCAPACEHISQDDHDPGDHDEDGDEEDDHDDEDEGELEGRIHELDGEFRVANSKFFYSSFERRKAGKRASATRPRSRDINNTDSRQTIESTHEQPPMAQLPITTTDPVMQATLTGTLLRNSHSSNMRMSASCESSSGVQGSSTLTVASPGAGPSSTPGRAAPITTTRSMRGSRSPAQPPRRQSVPSAPISPPSHPPPTSVVPSMVFIPDSLPRRQHPSTPSTAIQASNMADLPHQGQLPNTKDSGHVLDSSRHHRDRDIAPSGTRTQSTDVRPLPVVFPTSRTVFIKPCTSSSSISNASVRSHQQHKSSSSSRPRNSSLRNRPKSHSTQLGSEFAVHRPSVSHSEIIPHSESASSAVRRSFGERAAVAARRQTDEHSDAGAVVVHRRIPESVESYNLQRRPSDLPEEHVIAGSVHIICNATGRPVSYETPPQSSSVHVQHRQSNPAARSLPRQIPVKHISTSSARVPSSFEDSVKADFMATSTPTSSHYLQSLLESPPSLVIAGSSTTHPPVRNIRIHTSANRAADPRIVEIPTKQIVDVERRMPSGRGVASSMDTPTSPYMGFDFDYSRLLRPVKRDRVVEQGQRITALSTVRDA